MEKYTKKLSKYLKNTEGYLAAEYAEDYSSSSAAFHESIELSKSKSTFDLILSLLIFHQVTIELMKRLIIQCNFYQTLCLYPEKVFYKKLKTDSSFSDVKNELKYKFEFVKKNQLLEEITQINNLRTKYAHKVVQDNNIYSLELMGLNKSFEKIFELFEYAKTILFKKIEEKKKEEQFLKLLKNNE